MIKAIEVAARRQPVPVLAVTLGPAGGHLWGGKMSDFGRRASWPESYWLARNAEARAVTEANAHILEDCGEATGNRQAIANVQCSRRERADLDLAPLGQGGAAQFWLYCSALLLGYRVPGQQFCVIWLLYECSKSHIQIIGRKPKLFRVGVSLSEGCSLSALLFMILIGLQDNNDASKAY